MFQGKHKSPFEERLRVEILKFHADWSLFINHALEDR